MTDQAIQIAKAQIEAARVAGGKPLIRTFFGELTFTAKPFSCLTMVLPAPISRAAMPEHCTGPFAA